MIAFIYNEILLRIESFFYLLFYTPVVLYTIFYNGVIRNLDLKIRVEVRQDEAVKDKENNEEKDGLDQKNKTR